MDVVRIWSKLQQEIAYDENLLERLDLTKDEFEQLIQDDMPRDSCQLLKLPRSTCNDSDDLSEGFVDPYDTSNPVSKIVKLHASIFNTPSKRHIKPANKNSMTKQSEIVENKNHYVSLTSKKPLRSQTRTQANLNDVIKQQYFNVPISKPGNAHH